MRKIIIGLLLNIFTFISNAQTTFVGTMSVSGIDYSYSIHGADYDNDMDNDIVVGTKSGVVWGENNGSVYFNFHTISSIYDYVPHVYSADMDNDSDMDIVACFYSQNNKKLFWYENAGFGVFVEHLISNAVGGYSFHVQDINGDGLKDIISSAHDLNSIYKFINLGNGSFSATSIDNTLTDLRSVYSDDLDGDGDNDIIASSNTSLYWYENDGTSNFTKHSLTTNIGIITLVFAYDLDFDGDNDILVSSEQGTKMLENVVTGYFGAPVSRWLKCNSFSKSDINQDGYDDLVMSYNPQSGTGAIGCIIYNGATLTASVSHPPSDAFAIDIDGDGDGDLISSSHSLNFDPLQILINLTLEILTQPQNQTIAFGENGLLSFTAKDAQTYKWQLKNGANYVDIDDNTYFSGTNSNELTVTQPNIGQYIFRCRVSNNGGSQYTDDVTLTVQNPNNVESFNLNKVNIYPNPTTGIIHFDNPESLSINRIVISDGLGRIYLNKDFVSQIDINGFPAGIYYIKFVDDSGNVIYHKIIKQ